MKAKNLEEVIRLFEEYKEYTYSVAWIDCLKKGKDFGRSILILGEHATANELPSSKKTGTTGLTKEKADQFPIYASFFCVEPVYRKSI